MIRSAAFCFETHKWWQRKAKNAIESGMKKNGIAPNYKAPDCVVTWKKDPPQEFANVPHLILEAGYINGNGRDYIDNRLRFISTSWNERNEWSEWFWANSIDSDRWDSLGITMQPWKSVFKEGDYVLLLEQHAGDIAAPNVPLFRYEIQEHCKKKGWPLRVRRHPAAGSNPQSLEEDLADAWMAITWASTASVEAVIAGVPTYALGPRCIAAPVTSNDLSKDPYTGDRLAWAHRLAYRQWTYEELADGSAWPHIEQGLLVEH